MGKLGIFVIGFLVGGATVYGSLHFHLVRAADGFHVVPKLTSTFEDTYVDIRSFGFSEWNDHRSLAGALTRADKAHLFQGAVAQPFQNAMEQMVDFLEAPAGISDR